jgi:hypothetical protein
MGTSCGAYGRASWKANESARRRSWSGAKATLRAQSSSGLSYVGSTSSPFRKAGSFSASLGEDMVVAVRSLRDTRASLTSLTLLNSF